VLLGRRADGGGSRLLSGDPRVEALRAGITLDASRRPTFLLAADRVTIAGHEYPTLDLTTPDALAEVAGSVLSDLVTELLGLLGPAGPAIGLPSILPGSLVNGKDIGGRRMVAQEDHRVAIDDRRARVPPLDVERRDLLAQVPLPAYGAVAPERDQLPRTKPRVDCLAVGRGTRRREVVLLVHRRQRSFGRDAPFPQALAIGAGKRFDDKERAVRVRWTRTTASELTLTHRGGITALHEPRALARHAAANL